jgi:hypothetical protein
LLCACLSVFLWRRGEGFRLIVNLEAFGEGAPDAAGLCTPREYAECAFSSRADLLRFYRERVLPTFVRGGIGPAVFVDLRPA